MRTISAGTLLVLLLSFAGCIHPNLTVHKYDGKQVVVVFLDREKAFNYITNARFAEKMNDLNISIRLNEDLKTSDRYNNLSLYNKFLFSHLKRWDGYEKSAVMHAFEKAVNKLQHFSTTLIPDTIYFINTSLRLEFNSFFTINKAVCIPSSVTWPLLFDGLLEEKLAHEIFHIYSRYSEKSRDSLYALFDIYKADTIITGENLASKMIFNPDVQSNNYYFRLKDNSGNLKYLLLSVSLDQKKYDNDRGIISFLGVTNIFGYFRNNFYELEQTEPGKFQVKNKENPASLNPGDFSRSFDAACGCFSGNRYFAEEILAESLCNAMTIELHQEFPGNCSKNDKEKLRRILKIVRRSDNQPQK